MADAFPEKKRQYVGVITDTRAWDDFELRAGDVVISTPPKAGTTWMQTIVLMLIRKTAQLDSSVWYLSPWIDCVLRPQSPDMLNAQTGRRCIKSHAPFDGIKYSQDADYIAVYRHPVDIHFSLQRHVENMKEDWLDFMYASDTGGNFNRFLTFPPTETGTDDLTLASIAAHYLSFKRWADLPNVHIFHYAALKDDLRGQISRLNEILAAGCGSDLLDSIAEATSFAAMKSDAKRNRRRDEDSPFKDDAEFFATGRSGKWEGRLDEDSMARFESTLLKLLSQTDANYLAWGE